MHSDLSAFVSPLWIDISYASRKFECRRVRRCICSVILYQLGLMTRYIAGVRRSHFEVFVVHTSQKHGCFAGT
jgi:hypothetical protein